MTPTVLIRRTHSLTYGFDASLNKQKATDVYGRPDRSRPKSKGYDAGLFIQDEYAINPYLTLTPVLAGPITTANRRQITTINSGWLREATVK